MKLIFTKKLPTETGVYWRKSLGCENVPNQEPRICLIVERNGEFVHCSNMAIDPGIPLKCFDNGSSEWCGPLITPDEMNDEIRAVQDSMEFANES